MKKLFCLTAVLLLSFLCVGCGNSKNSLPPLATAKIGTMIGSTGESVVQQDYPKAENLRYNNYVDEAAALAAYKIDYALMDYATAWNYVKNNKELYMLPQRLTDDKSAIAMNKNNTELNKKINEVLNRMISDGTVAEIQSHWFKDDGSAYDTVNVPKVENGPVLRVAVTTLSEPRCFVKDGKITGMNIELFDRIAYELGMKTEYQDMAFSAMIDSLQSGKSDVIAAMYETPERDKQVDFSAGYLSNPVVLLVRKDRTQDVIGDVSDLNKADFTIGVPEGSPPEQAVKQYMPNAKISYFTNIVDGIAALKSGKVSAVCYDSASVNRLLGANSDLAKLPRELGDIEIAAVMRKSDAALCEQINEFIKKLKADGTLEQMDNRWIQNTGGKMPDIPEPKNPVKKLKVITNGMTEPMNFYENGTLTGYDIELIRRFADYANIDCEITTMDYSGMLPALQSGKGDIIVSDFYKTAEREDEVSYSETYAVLHNSVVVQKNMLAGAQAASGSAAVSAWLASLADSFRKTFIVEDRYKLILQGLWTTIVISALSVLFGSLLGAVVCAMRRSRVPVLSGIATVYIRLIQGVPIVLILMILYYILFAKVDIEPVFIAVVGFSINFAAYASEIFRTSINATDKGQLEAAYALGFSRRAGFFKITLPQALRYILPIYKGEFVSMVKMTSVVGYIAIQDLTKMSDIIRSRTFDAFFPLFMTAVIYFAITWLFIFALGKIELRIDPKRRKRVVKGITQPAATETEARA